MRWRPVGFVALAAVTMLVAAALASGAVVQQGNLRVTVKAQVKPFKLPRNGTAPISVFVAGRVAAVDGGIPPQLKRLTVQVNRHGVLDSRGLPVCEVSRVQPASTRRALANCRDSLVGSGRFWAHIVLPDQGAYATRGRLILFNGKYKGRRVLLAHIFTANPFYSSFVTVFRIRKTGRGTFRTELSASLPQTLGNWGYVDRIKFTVRRHYRARGENRSYFRAGCPAAPGVRFTAYPLARATLDFAGGKSVSATITKTCGVRR